MKFLKNMRGFTLVELMAAIGIAGVLMIVITNAQKQAITSSAGIKQNVEVNELIQRLTVELSKVEICSRNFGNNNPNFPHSILLSPVNYPVTTIYGANISLDSPSTLNGPAILSTNQKIGDQKNDYILINSILLNGAGANRIKITVSFTPVTSKLNYGAKSNVVDSFSVFINVFGTRADTTHIYSCFSDTQSALEFAVQQACKGADRVFKDATTSPPYGKCERAVDIQDSTGTTVLNSGTSYPCPAGELLAMVSTSGGSKILRCSKVRTTTSCAKWQYLSGVAADGSANCKNILDLFGAGTGIVTSKSPGTYTFVNLNCPAGYVLQKIDASYNPVCVNPNINANCPAGQYATGTDAAGAPICTNYSNQNACAGGMYMKAIDNVGNVTCTYPTFGGSCPAGYVASGIDGSGNVTCTVMTN